ncbi:MAG: DNA gyrase inhibitor YacG [Acidobacteria bacterium]|nr:DNA gyrase inhibitor YacG [Acidobacteriota bacterium]
MSRSLPRTCRICSKPVNPADKLYPFCSARCRTIDLGAWAAEEYVVSRPLTEADENLQPSAPKSDAHDDD